MFVRFIQPDLCVLWGRCPSVATFLWWVLLPAAPYIRAHETCRTSSSDASSLPFKKGLLVPGLSFIPTTTITGGAPLSQALFGGRANLKGWIQEGVDHGHGGKLRAAGFDCPEARSFADRTTIARRIVARVRRPTVRTKRPGFSFGRPDGQRLRTEHLHTFVEVFLDHGQRC